MPAIFIVFQWGLFDKQFGRADAQDPDPEGRVPIWENASVKEMKDKFSAVGLGPRQVLPHVLLLFLLTERLKLERHIQSKMPPLYRVEIMVLVYMLQSSTLTDISSFHLSSVALK